MHEQYAEPAFDMTFFCLLTFSEHVDRRDTLAFCSSSSRTHNTLICCTQDLRRADR